MERIAQEVGEPIILVSQPLPVPGLFAMTAHDEQGYVVFYQGNSVPAHQAHYITHELSHIVTGTVGPHSPSDDPARPRHSERRPGYEDLVEHDAELIATMILDWVRVWIATEPIPSSPLDERLAGLLGSPAKWR